MWRAADGENADMYLPLSQNRFNFTVPVPHDLPQTITIDNCGGIRYHLVAKMAAKVPRGFFHKEVTPVTLDTSHGLTLYKYELLAMKPGFYANDEPRRGHYGVSLQATGNWLPCAVGEAMKFQAIVSNRSQKSTVVEFVKVILLERMSQSDGTRTSTEKRIINSKINPIYREVNVGDTAIYDVDILVSKERALEDVTLAEHIRIDHWIVFEFHCDGEKFSLNHSDNTMVCVSPFPKTQSASLLDHIGYCESISDPRLPWTARPRPYWWETVNEDGWDSLDLLVVKSSGDYKVGQNISLRAVVYVTGPATRVINEITVMLQNAVFRENEEQPSKENIVATKVYHINEEMTYFDIRVYNVDIVVPKDDPQDVTDGDAKIKHKAIVKLNTREVTLVAAVSV